MVGLFLGIDKGGTTTRYGLFTGRGRSKGEIEREKTQRGDPKTTVKQIVAIVDRLRVAGRTIEAIGISFAGPVDSKGRVVKAPNIWGSKAHHVELAKMIEAETGLSVTIVNDMTAAAMREKMFGVARKFDSFLIITVSSGVGSKLVIDGEVLLGEEGVAGEIGHLENVGEGAQNDRKCGCGGFGHLETLASGKEAQRLARKMARLNERAFRRSELSALSENNWRKIDNRMLALAAQHGDRFALSVLDAVTRPLAIGIQHMLCASLPQKLVIMGGFALGVGDPYFNSLIGKLEGRVVVGKTLTETFLRDFIVRATNDDNSGVLGAAAVAVRSRRVNN